MFQIRYQIRLQEVCSAFSRGPRVRTSTWKSTPRGGTFHGICCPSNGWVGGESGGRGVVWVCFFFWGGGEGCGLQWWEWCWCLLMELRFRNKLILRTVKRNWGSGSGWNTVQVGWWFLVQVCWAQLFRICWSVNLQGLEEKVATKCRFLADRKAEDSQKDLGLSRWRVKLLKVGKWKVNKKAVSWEFATSPCVIFRQPNCRTFINHISRAHPPVISHDKSRSHVVGFGKRWSARSPSKAGQESGRCLSSYLHYNHKSYQKSWKVKKIFEDENSRFKEWILNTSVLCFGWSREMVAYT